MRSEMIQKCITLIRNHLMLTTSNAYAQLPRGEGAGSMFDTSDEPLGILFIIAVIHIYLGFKESSSQGLINFTHVAAIIAVIYLFPKLGSLLIAVLLGMLLYTIIKDYFR